MYVFMITLFFGMKYISEEMDVIKHNMSKTFEES